MNTDRVEMAMTDRLTTDTEPAPADIPDAVAVTGLACRFPGAADSAEFWSNLLAGRESLAFRTPEELAALEVPPERLADPASSPPAACWRTPTDSTRRSSASRRVRPS